MRGKLRDKRNDTKRYPLRREQMERRRPGKREVHNAILLKEQWDEEDYPLEDEKELVVADELKN